MIFEENNDRREWFTGPLAVPSRSLITSVANTHRVAIHNYRIKNIGNGKVTFSAKNRKKKKIYSVTLDAHEFIRRF
ncbi:MAG: transposase, partial [Pontiellaceae bacterium]|nr:transposase [Pontiellaceae bacterium]